MDRCSRLFLFLMFFAILASAQHPLVINYGKKDGLPSFESYDVLQDKEGFIWVPTDCGVVRYDGFSFKVYNTESGLRNNCVFKIFEDHRKRKWLTTSTNEICYIENDKIVYLPCSETFTKLAGPFAAKRLVVDKNEVLYISHRGVPWYFRIKPPYNDENIERIFLDQTIGYGYIEEVGDNFVYGTNGHYPYDKSIHLLHLRKGKKIFTFEVNAEFSTHIFAAAAGDGSYFMSEGKHLFKIQNDTAYLLKKFEKNIISITVHNDELWIGLYLGGVSKFNKNDFKFISTYLPNYSVSGACFDNESNLWLSTLEAGIFTIPPIGTKYLNESTGLTNEHILTAAIIKDKLAVGSYDGHIKVIEGEKVTDNITDPRINGVSNFVLFEYKEGVFWGGGNGAFIIQDGKFRQIYNELIKTASPHKNGVYMGSVSELLFYDGKITREVDVLNSRITRIYCDDKGKVWIGTNRGMASYSGDSIMQEQEFNKEFRGKITAIQQTKNGVLWVGTNGKGLFKIDNGKVIPFPLLKGDNIISCIYPDSELNMLWVATTQGVFLVDPVRNSRIRVLTLRQYSFDITNIVRTGDHFYLCTTQGIFMVDAKRLMNEPPVPSLYINTIEAAEKIYSPNEEVELPYSDARIRFTFKPISFTGVRPWSYKYKLHGGDGKWHFTENNTVEYGFLKPGKYKFTVVSCDESGNVSPKTADFSFVVHAPFYLRPWFIVTSIAGISLILGVSAYYLIRYSRKKEKLRNENEIKLADLELKALRSQMNPHFIFNSLNAVQGLILRNDSEGALTFMGKFSRLVRSVLENSEKPLISLAEEIAGLNLYLQLEQLKYDHIFNFSIIVDETIHPNQLFLPSMLIQPLVENAIQHGVVKSDRKGNIKVTFRRESDSTLLVVVEDNGVGFSHKKQKRAEDRISLGMKVTNERLKLLEKRMMKKISTSEISVNSVLGGGTAVYLKIPVYGKTTDAGYSSR